MSAYPYPGPRAPENNPTIQPGYFEPSTFPITALTRGTSTVLTLGTSFGVSANYVVGQLVRLTIPSTYGTVQLNEAQGYVTSLPASNQITVAIDSSNANAFVAVPSYGPTPPQVMAIGDVNSGIITSTGRSIGSGLTGVPVTIPGSFINISPL